MSDDPKRKGQFLISSFTSKPSSQQPSASRRPSGQPPWKKKQGNTPYDRFWNAQHPPVSSDDSQVDACVSSGGDALAATVVGTAVLLGCYAVSCNCSSALSLCKPFALISVLSMLLLLLSACLWCHRCMLGIHTWEQEPATAWWTSAGML
jgi:hypothetical protein